MLVARNPLRGHRSGKARLVKRTGAILVLTAFMIVVMFAFLALAIDLGYIMNVETELKRATDAAALAGAGSLVDGADSAELQAFEYFARNSVAGESIAAGESWREHLPELFTEHQGEFGVELGHWDPDTRTFVQGDVLPSSIRVTAAHNDGALFFARVLGKDSFSVTTESIARYLPRDIVLVLDFSASMNDDSELKRIGEYGESVRETIENNLLQIYQELGSPTYGNMQFEPQYISTTDTTEIKKQLGLLKRVGWSWVQEPYPYPRGSWDDYINYVKNYYGSPRKAGYYKKYGYLTLVNYWLESRPAYSDTPDLWKVSAQPVKAVKDSVGVFMDYIQAVDCEDRVGLVIYNSSSEYALVETELTMDFDEIEDTTQRRQAGHYNLYTNIGAGIAEARNELSDNARVGAFKMIVLMTDGQANRPYNESYAREYVIQQANLVAEEGYPIVTISLGNGADTGLMEQVAQITGGVHFNIPGGQDVVDYEAALLSTFRRIADDRPLVLVK